MINLYPAILKRIIDFIFALFALAILSPIIVILIIILSIVNNGKPFFSQPRPGKNEKSFKVIKFRTMNEKKTEDGRLLSDGERLTKVGTFVRKTSLDELPQLINIVIGDMSFIGPRPLLIRYLPYYKDSEKARHLIRPGITGLAQVNGRNLVDWDKRFAWDIYYVKHISFMLDVKIAFKTVINVINQKDIIVDATQVLHNLDDARKN